MHTELSCLYHTWLAAGNLRQGDLISEMKNAKRIFRRELRSAAHLYNQSEFERIDSLIKLDQQALWKILKSKKSLNRELHITQINVPS